MNVNLGITGANTGLDWDEPRWWNFTVTDAGAAAALQVVTANLTMKKDGSVTEPAVLSLYSGFTTNGSPGGNTLLGTVSMNASNFTNQFTPKLFSFNPTPSQLGVGAYSLILSTLETTQPGYFLKYNDIVGMTDPSTGAAISATYYASAGSNPTPYPTPTPTPTPAPGPTPVPEARQVAASVLLACGVAVYWVLKRRKRLRAA